MPPKKDPKKDVKATKKEPAKPKQVRFTKSSKKVDESNDNVILDPSKQEDYEKKDLDYTDSELAKETELETELEEEEENEEDDEDKDEDKDDVETEGVDDEIEYDNEEAGEELDELYDQMDDVKSKKKKVKKAKKDDDEEEQNEDEEDLCDYDYGEIYDEKKEEPLKIVDNNERITLPKLTKYERVRLIGTRAKQISLGAKILIKNVENLSPIEIAKLEVEQSMVPMKIKRILPDNTVEIWKLSELSQ
jgi:DNA-directed RNA polymerase I, II, and III subunit RPABC2